MFKCILVVSIVLFGSISGISYRMECDFQENGIVYVWENQPNYLASKRVFCDAFVKCYDQVPLDVLRKSSREEMVEWLDDAFEEIYADYKKSKNSLWLSAKVGDKVAGCLIIDIAKYPEEIYLAELAVDPVYQRQGIASSMIRRVFDQFSECGRFVVITRCANEEAKGLYNALGFAPSSYMHEGYSRELYTGFEYSKQQ
ncbi:MAG: GNAT family N-acetyltransferase [Verrucomicrobia bacterium]|nr:GNAT family N-acetyltransferase [Verrucomicrobiota bacterium]